jgi:hypothetical protein
VLEIHVADHGTLNGRRGDCSIWQWSPAHQLWYRRYHHGCRFDGASVLISAVRELDSLNIKILDIIMRWPSLDDVFMALTGIAPNNHYE